MKLHSEISLGWLVLYAGVLLSVTGNNIVSSDETLIDTGDKMSTDPITGEWRLFEYYEDRGDGKGIWRRPAAELCDTISFYSDGSFSATGTTQLSTRQFDKYKLLGTERLVFISTASAYTESCTYTLESPQQLLLSLLCRERCMRRYKLIKKFD